MRIRPSMNWTRIRWEGDTLDIHGLAMQREKRRRELSKRFWQEAGPSVMSVIMRPLCRTEMRCLSSSHKAHRNPASAAWGALSSPSGNVSWTMGGMCRQAPEAAFKKQLSQLRSAFVPKRA